MTKTRAHYKHISFPERVKIETLLNQRLLCSEIAIILNRSSNTIYSEVNRNLKEYSVYTAKEAQERAIRKRVSANNAVHTKMVRGSITHSLFMKKLSLYHSPEQIVNKYRKSKRFKVRSSQTIYTYIAKQNPELKIYLRRGKKKYRKNHTKAKYLDFTSKKAQHSIDKRPKSIEKRKSIGHWEGDTIIGQEKTSRILTYVERKTGLLIAKKIDHDLSGTVAMKTIQAFRRLPRKMKKTITYDNGVEFAEYLCIENILKLKVYFAHPYHSWERGTNENTNGLLRQFYPKGTYLRDVTQKDLDEKVKLINNRPRKRLNYQTPNEVFKRSLLV